MSLHNFIKGARDCCSNRRIIMINDYGAVYKLLQRTLNVSILWR